MGLSYKQEVIRAEAAQWIHRILKKDVSSYKTKPLSTRQHRIVYENRTDKTIGASVFFGHGCLKVHNNLIIRVKEKQP